MLKPEAIADARKQALVFLERQQQADGSFISYSSARRHPFRRLRSWRTTFVPALMLSSLASLEDRRAVAINKRLAAFLITQKGSDGAFNYWSKAAPEYHDMAYPADLDDTFCALAALRLHDTSLVDEGLLAQAVRLLLATETAVGGPYRTWVVAADSEPVWLDVDLAVNTNVAFFLSLIGSRLPALDGLMGEAIKHASFTSPYYPSVYPFLYYLSRAYVGPEQARLLDLVRHHERHATTELDLALCIAARLRLGDEKVDSAVRRLLAKQRRDGSWAPAAFYADPDKESKRYYNGGPELTTAFVLEALQLYEQMTRPKSVPDAAESDRVNGTTVLSAARRQSRTLQPELRQSVSRMLTRIARSSEGPEIAGLPFMCYGSLVHPKQVSRNFLVNLGAANLYGWLAYTIYDDFLDDEGRPELLSAANVSMRRSFRGFLDALPDSPTFQAIVSETFDSIDAANAWELAHCRSDCTLDRITIRDLPDYGDLSKLAERSLGHTLGPIAVLTAQNADSAAVAHCREALRQYLIVRQLHDDLHDWQEDLAAGHITAVVCSLLSEAHVGSGVYATAELIDRLKMPFWHDVLPPICGDMTRRIGGAREALRLTGIFMPASGMNVLLDRMEVSVRDTLAKQQQAAAFLGHYKRESEKNV